jgi:hypothetical protein
MEAPSCPAVLVLESSFCASSMRARCFSYFFPPWPFPVSGFVLSVCCILSNMPDATLAICSRPFQNVGVYLSYRYPAACVVFPFHFIEYQVLEAYFVYVYGP